MAQTRGLTPTEEIILAPVDAELGVNAGVSPPIASYDGAPLAEVERVYRNIGLLPHGVDFREALAEFRRLERLISYDRATGRVSWSAGAARLGAPLVRLDPEKARDLAPVFAIVHALQEQHFEWRTTIDKLSVEDRRSAYRAVAAGDALLTLMAGGSSKDDVKVWPAIVESSARVAAELDRLATALPDFLRRQLTFPYRSGPEFAYWAFRARGWAGVNLLYASPPLSSAEILHPRRYYVERESRLRFFPPNLLRRFKTGVLVEQTLGEDTILGLLASEWPARSAAETAAAWRGDQLFGFVKNTELTTAWFTSWRTETQAEEFLRAYRAVLESRHRLRFDFPRQRSALSIAIARAPDQRGWLIQRDKAVVLLVSTAPASRLTEVASEAWKDLEIDNETREIRFESAQAPAQFSVNSR